MGEICAKNNIFYLRFVINKNLFISHKEHQEREEHKEEFRGFCPLSYREVYQVQLNSTNYFP
jgi:hypothetical protein